MVIADRFQAYADAFEAAYADDDWSRLEEYFTEDCEYDAGQGPEHVTRGRDNLLAWFQGAVNDFDRKMDSREIVFAEAPRETSSGVVTVPWKAIFKKSGAPALVMSGIETAEFEGDRIRVLRDAYDEGVPELIDAWMSEHGV